VVHVGDDAEVADQGGVGHVSIAGRKQSVSLQCAGCASAEGGKYASEPAGPA